MLTIFNLKEGLRRKSFDLGRLNIDGPSLEQGVRDFKKNLVKN